MDNRKNSKNEERRKRVEKVVKQLESQLTPQQKRKRKNTRQSGSRIGLVIIIVLIVLTLMQMTSSDSKTIAQLAYSSFLDEVSRGNITEVSIVNYRKIQGKLRSGEKNQTAFETVIPYDDPALIQSLRQYGVKIEGIKEEKSQIIMILVQYLPWLAILIVFWIFISRQMQGPGNRAMSFGKTRAKMFNEEDTKETFNDVEGCREAKEDLQEIIAFLKEPKKFTDLGARIPKGVLLMGPPGTGKTLLAKAVAGEAKVPFFHMSGSEFVEMFVGVGASRVRDLFEQGRKNAPCIIFIDELDAVGRSRGAGYGGGHDEREQTLNQMLVEMDGFDTTEAVIIMAATNRPDVLDPALLRPGRFDRQVIIDLPDVAGREGILKIHARKVKLDVAAELSNIARGTPGFSGADLANLINEAALLTGRRNKLIISMSELEEAKDKVMMGPERRSMIISESEKKNTAFHEAGHALVSLLTPQADFLHKVSIIPRGRALGLTQSLPDDGSHTMSKNKLEARLRVLMAGRVAEEIFIGDYSNGAANDIERATRIARAMVCEWGMSSLGPVAYGQKEEPIFIGKEIARHKDYSEEKARSIDDEVDKIILSAYADVKKLLTREKNRLKRLAEALLEKEVMNSHEIGTLLGIKIKEQEDLRKTASPFKSTVPAEESPAAPVTEKI